MLKRRALILIELCRKVRSKRSFSGSAFTTTSHGS
uniref:Uncharacterized protein n=1 Tax=Arundo donax TaxID=35708 RepID=A0A0A9CNI4_ARUDO